MLQPGWVTSEDVTVVTMVPDYLSHKYYYSDYSDKTFINGWVNLFCPNSFVLNVADTRSQGKHGHLVNGMSTQTLGPLTLDLFLMRILKKHIWELIIACLLQRLPVLSRPALWRHEDTEMFCNNPDSGSMTRLERVQPPPQFCQFHVLPTSHPFWIKSDAILGHHFWISYLFIYLSISTQRGCWWGWEGQGVINN